MPPLFRVDVGKQVFYALDEAEQDALLQKIEREKMKRRQISVTRFKGLGEMNPSQLRESTIHPDTRRLVQLTVGRRRRQRQSLMDMLLSKKRAADRKSGSRRKAISPSLRSDRRARTCDLSRHCMHGGTAFTVLFSLSDTTVIFLLDVSSLQKGSIMPNRRPAVAAVVAQVLAAFAALPGIAIAPAGKLADRLPQRPTGPCIERRIR